MAKWLRTRPRLLVLDEPTQGVDVGGKAEILELLRDAARDGVGVLDLLVGPRGPRDRLRPRARGPRRPRRRRADRRRRSRASACRKSATATRCRMPPEVEAPPPEAPSSHLLRRLLGSSDADEPRAHSLLERYGGLGLLLAMIVLFSVTLPGKFLTYDNLIGVVSNQTIGGIMALALLLPLAAGVFDISIGGAMTLAVVLVTWLFQTTEWLDADPARDPDHARRRRARRRGQRHARREDPRRSVHRHDRLQLGAARALGGDRERDHDLERHPVGRSPTSGARSWPTSRSRSPTSTVVAIALWYLLEQTPFGRRVYATGAARDASRLAGVKTDRVIFLSFVASAVAGDARRRRLRRADRRRAAQRRRQLPAAGVRRRLPRLDDDPAGPLQRARASSWRCSSSRSASTGCSSTASRSGSPTSTRASC